MVFALDLEGVLAPEIWPLLGAQFDLPELSLTTRDLGDFEELMRRRVEATRRRGLRLSELQVVAHAVEPFFGARDFLARLRGLGQVLIISDTFHELSEPLVQKLGGHNLFANRFEIDLNTIPFPTPGNSWKAKFNRPSGVGQPEEVINLFVPDNSIVVFVGARDPTSSREQPRNRRGD